MSTVSIEIGSYGIKGCVKTSGKPVLLELGSSASPYFLSSVAIIDKQGEIILGAPSFLDECTSNKVVYLSEYDIEDPNFIDVFSTLFKYVQNRAELQVGEKVSKLLLVVPPQFVNHDPRKAKLKYACEKSGISDIDFVSSDIAICYQMVKLASSDSALLCDIGHSVTRVSVIKREGNMFETLSQGEILGYAGQNFENSIFQDIEDKNFIAYNEEFELLQMKQIEQCCRYMKEALSTAEDVSMNLPFASDRYTISRSYFESIIRNAVETSVQGCVDCLSRSGIEIQNLRQIVLVGGSSHIPLVHKMMSAFFQTTPASKSLCSRGLSIVESQYAGCFGAFSVPSIQSVSFILSV